jgi:hypothetical protein
MIPAKPVDDIKMPMSVFQELIAVAKANGQEWVETTPEIIKILQPRGMGPVNYFIYHGVKVCEIGKREEITDELSTPMGKKIHGESESTVISG